MNYGICDQAVVPVRQQPGEGNEMVNQLLFGDLVVIKGNVKDWLLIETFDDQYEGWIDKKQLSILSNEEFNELIIEKRFYALDLATEVFGKNTHKKLLITRGASLFGYSDQSFIHRTTDLIIPEKYFLPARTTVSKISKEWPVLILARHICGVAVLPLG